MGDITGSGPSAHTPRRAWGLRKALNWSIPVSINPETPGRYQATICLYPTQPSCLRLPGLERSTLPSTPGTSVLETRSPHPLPDSPPPWYPASRDPVPSFTGLTASSHWYSVLETPFSPPHCLTAPNPWGYPSVQEPRSPLPGQPSTPGNQRPGDPVLPHPSCCSPPPLVPAAWRPRVSPPLLTLHPPAPALLPPLLNPPPDRAAPGPVLPTHCTLPVTPSSFPPLRRLTLTASRGTTSSPLTLKPSTLDETS
nr:extensin-like [Salvelinus alpinus]